MENKHGCESQQGGQASAWWGMGPGSRGLPGLHSQEMRHPEGLDNASFKGAHVDARGVARGKPYPTPTFKSPATLLPPILLHHYPQLATQK